MNEVDFTGWNRTDDNLYKIRTSPKYRSKIHWNRFTKAIKQKRWNWFTWWNIKGLLCNETKQF
jgi:hypothetical protein